MGKFALLVAIVLFLPGCSEPLVIDYSGPTDDWPAYGSGPGGGHYSEAAQITPENVTRLEQAWIFQSPPCD